MGIETDFATRMTPVTIQKSRVHIKTTEAHLTLQRSKKNHRTNVCLNAYVRTYVRTYVKRLCIRITTEGPETAWRGKAAACVGAL